jgi:hypothetical protein
MGNGKNKIRQQRSEIFLFYEVDIAYMHHSVSGIEKSRTNRFTVHHRKN